MKKRTIWIIAAVMGLSFLGLLYLQLKYIDSMVKMKREQFAESVNNALHQTVRNLELTETLRYLEHDVNETERKAFRKDSTGTVSGTPDGTIQQSHQFSVTANDGTTYSSFELKTITAKPSLLKGDKNAIADATKSMREIVQTRYVYQKALLDEVIYSILYTASDKPLKERVNFKTLDQDLKAELTNNGIDLPYHFTVATRDGREVYRCPDYTDDGDEYAYTQALFTNDASGRTGVLRVHFPEMNSYIFSSVAFMIPAVAFSAVLLVTTIFTIVIIFRQKRHTELKNDFINNMTHELKTPISSISIAAQMLSDESVAKSPQMMARLGGVINDESKRLRFLVEKVLQMSLFERKKAIFKKKELTINDLVESVANTFTLRVEHTGGHINMLLKAEHPKIYVDETHFENVITNQLDIAVKYSHPDRSVELTLRTWNDKDNLYLSVRDNGIGIKKENLKTVFKKFYRVHTGNVHDVKGFGLGLAYVKRIVELHKGDIRAESTAGKGTTFIISMPIIRTKAEDDKA